MIYIYQNHFYEMFLLNILRDSKIHLIFAFIKRTSIEHFLLLIRSVTTSYRQLPADTVRKSKCLNRAAKRTQNKLPVIY